MKRVVKGFVDVLSSLNLSVALLVILGLLTWFGTLEQVEMGLFDVQKKYFESFFLVHWLGPIPIPLPGANLVLCVLFVNLLVGGVIRMRRGLATAGILITHLGIGLLLLSGFVKLYFSDDGHVTLFETERSNYFQSYYRWELAVTEELADGSQVERVLPQETFYAADASETVSLTDESLPFDLELSNFMRNCRPMPKGPMFEVDVPVVDGFFLRREAPAQQAEQNLAGAYVSVVNKRDQSRKPGILWGVDSAPMTVEMEGRRWGIGLRHERYRMPFTIELEDFRKVDHPRMTMAKEFSSDVKVVEGGAERPVRISMNEPLRDHGLVLYQASWGPSNARPGDPLFSTLSVVRNPADQYPKWACYVIGFGLVLHFGRKLMRYARKEARS